MAEENAVVVPESGSAPNDSTNTPGEKISQNTQNANPNPGAAPDKQAEDQRNRGILADLQKERKERQQIQAEVAQYKAELAAERRRVQALAGVNPQSPEETEAEQVRQRFNQLFPNLAKLDEATITRLQELAQNADSLTEATTNHWVRHGTQMLDAVTSAITTELGGNLSERQAARIKSAYVAAAEGNPEFLARHERGDMSLVKEFVREWAEDFFEPARRKVLSAEVERARRVPGSRDRSVVNSGGKKVDYNDPKAFEQALVDSFKGHGGAFGD